MTFSNRSVGRMVGACALLFGAACSSSESGTATPNDGGTPTTPTPPTPSPIMVLSADSVVGAAVVGTAAVSGSVQITAGNSAGVSSLAVGNPQYTSASGWLSTSINSTTAPATLTFTLDPRALTPGSYDATVPVTAGGGQSANIRVKFTARPRPVLRATPGALTIDVGTADSSVFTTIALTSSGDPISGLIANAPSCGGGPVRWLSSSLSGTTTPASLILRGDFRGMAIGSYPCSTTIASDQPHVDSASQSIATTFVAHPSPKLALSRTTIIDTLSSAQGDKLIELLVTNAGDGALDQLSVGDIEYGPEGSGWIRRVTFDQTTAPARVTIAIPRTIAPGGYTATIPILSDAKWIANSPQKIDLTAIANTRPPVPPEFVISPTASIAISCRADGKPHTFGQTTVKTGLGISADIRSVSLEPFYTQMAIPPVIRRVYPTGTDPFKLPQTFDLEVTCKSAGLYAVSERFTTATSAFLITYEITAR